MRNLVLSMFMILGSLTAGGCATIRVTDPPRTATEQFLLSGAATRAIDQLSAEALRDRKVYLETQYLGGGGQEQQFLIGELRAKLFLGGVRLVSDRKEAQVVMELRSGGLGIDRLEFLLGIPAIYVSQYASSGNSAGGLPITTPELAIVKSTKQRGFAAVAYVAYWADTGEVLASSGPFIGRTYRDDWWLFGAGPRTVGNIPPAQKSSSRDGG
jgi:hypothetical protein